MVKVAVEQGLSDIQQALQENGHEVVSMENLKNASCCVISGQDHNMMGMSDIFTQAPVINADGMSAQEVVQEVNTRTQNISF
jgi:Uncharacterised protein family (UPF0180)